jgi:hypothetical protein
VAKIRSGKTAGRRWRAAREDLQRQDTDEWWRERRVLARKLIDLGDPATAYQVARGGAPPANPYYRAEFHFMAGWIALRFLDAPTTALEQFAHIADGMSDPITLARGAYWRGPRTAGLVRWKNYTEMPSARLHAQSVGFEPATPSSRTRCPSPCPSDLRVVHIHDLRRAQMGLA